MAKHYNDEDWFSAYAPYWLQHLGYMKDQEIHALEIGSYEGRSACWMMDNLLTHPKSTLTCIDTWDGKDATLGEKTKRAEKNFYYNVVEGYGLKIRVHKKSSLRALCQIHHFSIPPCFDLIYVDGSHEGIDVLTDLCLCWPLLKVGGWLVMDDFNRDPVPNIRVQPCMAYDAFRLMQPIGLKERYQHGRQLFSQKLLTEY